MKYKTNFPKNFNLNYKKNDYRENNLITNGILRKRERENF